MVKLRYKSLVVNFLIGVSGIVIGYCICSNLNAVPLLQSQNTRIAHGKGFVKGVFNIKNIIPNTTNLIISQANLLSKSAWLLQRGTD